MPTLDITPLVRVGQPFQLQVSNLPAPSYCVLELGLRGDQWGGVQLPFPLDQLGMPGCWVYEEPVFHFHTLSLQGGWTWQVQTPNLPGLVGAEMFNQVFFTQPGLNAIQVGTTNGLHAVITGLPQYASSLTQDGITWTFDQPYPVGQFCNGDWWVVGPVNITDISPHTQVVNGRSINGSMINPNTTGRHGYDSTLYAGYTSSVATYDSTLNVAIGVSATAPLAVATSSSLISTISQMTSAPNSASELKTAAVLTVLSQEPPANSFRPPYTGTDKTIHWREAQLDYGVLGRLTPYANAPSLTTVANGFSRVWLDHCTSWTSRFMHPVDNMPDYYREFTTLTGNAGLLLNCDYSFSQKRDLLVGLVQLGIDNYGNILNGARWGVNGHCNGRKFPILFAGRVLGDAAMLGVGTTFATIYNGPNAAGNSVVTFSEDGQTFYVAETSPGVYNWGYGGYNASMVGMPEWGNFHADSISGDNSSWTANSYRLCCSANGWVGTCLTMRIMGMQAAWNQPAWFDYMDRYLQTEPVGSWTRAWDGWQANMWDQYRAQF